MEPTVAAAQLASAIGLLGDTNIQELSEERFIGTLVYPVADPNGATLTVRQREADPRVTPAGLAWRLVDDRHVEITRPSAPGFDRGAIYEFIYRARDPIVMGIGFAAIREIVSFLRHDTADNPLAPQGRTLTGSFGGVLRMRGNRERNRKFVDSPLEGSGFELPVPQMHLVEQLFGAGIDQVLGGPISSGGMMMRS